MAGLRRVCLAAVLIAALAGCGAGSETRLQAAETGDPRSGPCLTAMTDSLVAAFRASDGAKDPDEAFAAAAGKLPAPCRLLDSETLKKLLKQATEAAIVRTTGPETTLR
ncbi:MAG: hypothetical protein ACT4P1_14615 [Sporichthyaceae bacterium]